MAGEAAEAEQDVFNLSDEDFAARSNDLLIGVDNEQEGELEEVALEPEEVPVTDDIQEENEEEVDQEDSGSEETDEDAPDEEAEESEPDQNLEGNAEDEGEPDTGEADESPINYKQEYENLLATFKANGKDMKVDSVEDARRLMQMGANYKQKDVGP